MPDNAILLQLDEMSDNSVTEGGPRPNVAYLGVNQYRQVQRYVETVLEPWYPNPGWKRGKDPRIQWNGMALLEIRELE